MKTATAPARGQGVERARERAQRLLATDELRPVQVARRDRRAGLRRAADDVSERGRDVVRVAEPVLRPLPQQLHHEGIELERHAVRAGRRRNGHLVEMTPHDRERVRPAEDGRARDGPVEKAAERVEVGPRVDRLAADLLRRHVRDRAAAERDGVEEVAPDRLVPLREPEVDDDGPAIVADDDVPRREVAMDEAIRMEARERVADADQDPERLLPGRVLEIELAAAALTVRLPHVVLERVALDELHRVPGTTADDALIEDANDARMAHATERVDLPADRGERVGAADGNGLQRDVLARGDADRVVDDPHAAAAERLEHAVSVRDRRAVFVLGVVRARVIRREARHRHELAGRGGDELRAHHAAVDVVLGALDRGGRKLPFREVDDVVLAQTLVLVGNPNRLHRADAAPTPARE